MGCCSTNSNNHYHDYPILLFHPHHTIVNQVSLSSRLLHHTHQLPVQSSHSCQLVHSLTRSLSLLPSHPISSLSIHLPSPHPLALSFIVFLSCLFSLIHLSPSYQSLLNHHLFTPSLPAYPLL